MLPLAAPPPPLAVAEAAPRTAPLVAVLDTGVDAADPALAGRLAGGARSFVPGSPHPLRDPEGHGTQVAAIVAAGAGPRARILPVTVADRAGGTTTGALVRGLRYATVRGARVINVSFGGRGFSRPEQDAIDAAVRGGALVVVAAGNTGTVGGPPQYPGAYRQVLAVAALGDDGRPMAISARGPHIALSARGTGRRPGARAHGPARAGTSMAAAVVSGAAARVAAARPGLSPHRLRALLEATARDVPPRGPDAATGAGEVRVAAALRAPAPPPEDPEPNDDTALAARTPPLLAAQGPRRGQVRGRTGSWSDPRDCFRVYLAAGERLTARLRGPRAADLDLVLWRPGTPGTRRGPAFSRRWLAAASLGPTSGEEILFTAPRAGVHTLEVRGVRGAARYVLSARRARAGGR